ncbi:MAG: hypothetical protein AAF870_08480 [Pseudomonadota bacterium]
MLVQNNAKGTRITAAGPDGQREVRDITTGTIDEQIHIQCTRNGFDLQHLA